MITSTFDYKIDTIQSIDIQGRVWFQKSYGNSYFSGEMYINDELITSVSFQYGSKDYCKQYLIEKAIEEGKLPEMSKHLSGWRYLNSLVSREQQLVNIYDVKRKKDLK